MFDRYPTCYFIPRKNFHLQNFSGNAHFQLFSEQHSNIRISLNFNEFISHSSKFIQNTCLFLIKIITTTHPFLMISIFIDTLHVTLFQKNIFIFKLSPVLLIFNLFLNCMQFLCDLYWISIKLLFRYCPTSAPPPHPKFEQKLHPCPWPTLWEKYKSCTPARVRGAEVWQQRYS